MPAAQSVTAEHSRSVVVVGAADVYCPLGQLEEDVLHVRSDVNVGADDSYCVPSHVCTALHALPSFASEYVVPSVHAVHCRSAVAEGVLDAPCPVGQVAHAAQASVAVTLALALALYVPEAQVAHSRSPETVAATLVYVPAAQAADTALHALPSFSLFQLVPSPQDAQLRSTDAEGVFDAPWPTGHVAQAAQESVDVTLALVPVLNVSDGHAVHATLLLTVAATLVYVPAAQAEDTAVHAAPLSASEYVVPSSQAVHVRSDEAEGAAVCPWPAGQVAQSAQEPKPAEAVNLSLAQSAQVRSDEVVSSAVSYLPAAHSALNAVHAAPLSASE